MDKKKIRKIGVIDTEGYELDNRVYDKGGGITNLKEWKCKSDIH